jgi:hypothetical protein
VLGYGLVELVCQPGEVPVIDREQQRRLVGEVLPYTLSNHRGPAATPAKCSLASRAAAVHWHKDENAHLRLYSQDADNFIVEICYDPPLWTKGQTFTGARPGTGLAALALFDNRPRVESIHLMLYYQAANNQIVEMYWNGDKANGWAPIHAFQGAAQGTGIVAVYFLDESNDPHKRRYYQDTSNLIIEQCWDGDEWTLGQTFTGATCGSTTRTPPDRAGAVGN